MNQLKVVHVTETFASGVYTYLEVLSSVFELEEEIKNIIVYSGQREETPSNLFSNSTTLVEMNMSKEINLTQDFKSFIGLYMLLKKMKPDIIHVHSSKAGFIGRLASIFLFKRAKVFYTPHGFSFLRTDVSKIKQRIFYGLEKTISFLSKSTIIACGDTELVYAKQLGNALLIRNGVRINELAKYFEPMDNDKITVGILSRITQARNPTLFNRIALRFPELRFLWIGDGELREQLTAPNIEVTGWFKDKKKGYLHLNKVDIYIQTSLWEGLPIAVLEAMALKKPVVASNVIGNKDAVSHNETGYLFNDYEEACVAIEKLIQNKTIRKKLGESGFERCKSYFDVDQNFQSISKIYRQA